MGSPSCQRDAVDLGRTDQGRRVTPHNTTALAGRSAGDAIGTVATRCSRGSRILLQLHLHLIRHLHGVVVIATAQITTCEGRSGTRAPNPRPCYPFTRTVEIFLRPGDTAECKSRPPSMYGWPICGIIIG